MTDERAFIQTIRDNLDDDGPRLVYADWLEERGDPRGELLRLVCEVRRMRRELERIPRRIDELMAATEASWLADVVGRFRVVLTYFSPERKISTIKIIRQILPIGLKEAKDMSEALPAIVIAGITWQHAEQVRQQFAGTATVEIQPSSAFEPTPPGSPVIEPRYRITLLDYLSPSKLPTIDAIRRVTNLNLEAASAFVESLPRVLLHNATVHDVQSYRSAFQPFAELRIEPATVP